jgi:hypothetical protein
MRKNVGGIDKGLRIAAGLALLALGAFGPLGWVGADRHRAAGHGADGHLPRLQPVRVEHLRAQQAKFLKRGTGDTSMPGTIPRKRLLPWVIGLVIIVVAIGAAAWLLSVSSCGAPVATIALVLLVMPAVYLALMYLTLTSQA